MFCNTLHDIIHHSARCYPSLCTMFPITLHDVIHHFAEKVSYVPSS